MKRILLYFMLVTSLPIFSQVITVDTGTYTVPQLVTDILVNKPCVPVNNITWRTGTNFGSTNGIGYFQNTNPAFPLTSGVVLTTGNVLNSPGPNSSQLDDGNVAWTGDADLEATLLAAGITMNSTNATVLEFDFTPFSSNFNFQFLFASEEYGTFQCLFSDAFAFLLTNTATAVTTNIAVVPSTTIPISVETIRDNLYNSGCPSANPTYFGSFNGGSSAAGSATNYNGQTVVMNASAVLTPNVTYHIKLVIADRADFEADSAIFLAANSFNVGQDVLGPDLTLASGTALCDNDTYTIASGLDPAIFSFQWTLNGAPIGGNTPDLLINQPGTYGLTYTIISSSCVVTTDYKEIEFLSPIVTPDPVDLYLCDSGQPNYTYNLAFNTPIVTIPNTVISYHASLADANGDINPLPTSYTVAAGSLPATVYVRIESTTNGCFIVKPFQLALTPQPTPQTPWEYRMCEDLTGSGVATFVLPSQDGTALNGVPPALFTVYYYTNSVDANNGTNFIDTTFPYVSGNTTIYVRVQSNTDSNCFTVTNFNLVVIPTPSVPDLPDQYVCFGYTLPSLLPSTANYYTGPNGSGTMLNAGDLITTDMTIYIYLETGGTPNCNAQTSFTVTIVDVNEIGPISGTYCDQYILPPYPMVGSTYWENGPGGPNLAGNVELFPGNAITTNGQVVWTHFIGTDIPTPCELDSNFTVTINITPTLDPVSNQFDCVSYILPPLTTGDYYTGPNGTGILLPAGTPILTTTQIFVYADNNGCSANANFAVFIDDVRADDVDACTQYIVDTPNYGEYRDAPNGGGNIIPTGTVITTNTTIYTYVPGAGVPNCTDNDFFTVTIHQPTLTDPVDPVYCGNYLLPNNPEGARYFTLAGGPATFGNVELFPLVDSITTTTTIYVYKESPTLVGCFIEKPWTITINPRPTIDSRGDILVCTTYNLTPLVNGSYFDNAYDPNNPGSQVPITDLTIDLTDLNAGDDLINNAKIIYITAVNPNDPFCYTENSFRVEFDGLDAGPIPPVLSHCDTYTLPVLPANNFYYTLAGGPSTPGNVLLSTVAERTITTTTSLFIYTSSNNRIPCSDDTPFTITIYYTPVITPPVPPTITACDTYTLSPLTIGRYYTMSGGPSVPGNTEIVAPVTYTLSSPPPAVIYVYADAGTTAPDPACPATAEIRITLNNVSELGYLGSFCDSYQLDPTQLQPGENYYSQPFGNPADILAPNAIINTPGMNTIWKYKDFGPGLCFDQDDFTVNILSTPVITPPITPIINRCDNYTLLPLTVGRYYTMPGGPLAPGNTEIIAPITYDVNNAPPAVIYVYADAGTTAPDPLCPTTAEIRITLFNVTQFAPNPPVGCGSYQLDPTVLQPGENYYSNTGGVGLLASNATLVTSQRVYIYAMSPFGCSDETFFDVTIVPVPVANFVPVVNRTVCDNDGTNDGVTSFDLTTLNALVLMGQVGPEFTVTYYESLADANAQTSPVTSTILATAYVRVNNTLSTNCFDIEPISIIVNKIPEPHLNTEYFICEDYETGTLLNPVVLNTGLSGSNYSFAWTIDDGTGPVPVAGNPNTPSITATAIGTYEVTVTDTSLNPTCSKTISTIVRSYAPYITVDYSNAFETPSRITVNVAGSGSGNYEYQLDDGPFQDSNVFYNVLPGDHIIHVRDKNGLCSPAPMHAVIINYPKFFTPNGDGHNETWNIIHLLSTNPDAPIYIFDRFGKFIKQITPSSEGWDGTYNGNPLPSTDYWFTVDYDEKGSSKTFRAHFALKR